MTNILVTGGSGLIGWRATEQLLELGHRVVVYDKHPNRANLAGMDGDLAVVARDITDLAQLVGTLKKHRINRVLHLAAYISHESNADPAGAFKVNTIGTANVFDAALALDVERVCWTSTIMAVGGSPDQGLEPQGPEVVYAPRTAYGVAKYATEIMADGYAEMLGLDVVGIRPPTAYGIGRLEGGTGELINDQVRKAALGEAAVFRGGVRPSELIYNRDMARLLVTALLAPTGLPARIYNTPVEARYSVEQIAETLRALLPDAEISTQGYPAIAGLPPLLDGGAAEVDLGFSPEYSLAEGFAEMIEHFSAATGRVL